MERHCLRIKFYGYDESTAGRLMHTFYTKIDSEGYVGLLNDVKGRRPAWRLDEQAERIKTIRRRSYRGSGAAQAGEWEEEEEETEEVVVKKHREGGLSKLVVVSSVMLVDTAPSCVSCFCCLLLAKSVTYIIKSVLW